MLTPAPSLAPSTGWPTTVPSLSPTFDPCLSHSCDLTTTACTSDGLSGIVTAYRCVCRQGFDAITNVSDRCALSLSPAPSATPTVLPTETVVGSVILAPTQAVFALTNEEDEDEGSSNLLLILLLLLLVGCCCCIVVGARTISKRRESGLLTRKGSASITNPMYDIPVAARMVTTEELLAACNVASFPTQVPSKLNGPGGKSKLATNPMYAALTGAAVGNRVHGAVITNPAYREPSLNDVEFANDGYLNVTDGVEYDVADDFTGAGLSQSGNGSSIATGDDGIDVSAYAKLGLGGYGRSTHDGGVSPMYSHLIPASDEHLTLPDPNTYEECNIAQGSADSADGKSLYASIDDAAGTNPSDPYDVASILYDAILSEGDGDAGAAVIPSTIVDFDEDSSDDGDDGDDTGAADGIGAAMTPVATEQIEFEGFGVDDSSDDDDEGQGLTTIDHGAAEIKFLDEADQ
jgi:hypothetical protein